MNWIVSYYYQYIIMGWVFDSCPDKYGHCIRQFVFLALTTVTLLVATYATLMTQRKLHQFKFQLLPLSINAVASLYIFIASLQQQQESTYLIMLLVEIYSYSLLSYTYIGLYLRGTNKITTACYKRFKQVFIMFSILVGLAIIALIILEVMQKIKCEDKLGIGNIVLSLCETPLYIFTFIYIYKTKGRIRELQSDKQGTEHVQLLNDEDTYIMIKLKQANITLASFTLSLVLHIATSIMFLTDAFSCAEGQYSTNTLFQVIMLSLFDVGTLLPHLVMPYIFYFLTTKYSGDGNTVTIMPKIGQRQSSHLSEGIGSSNFQAQENLRQNLLHRIGHQN